ncbi:MAG: NAD-dependent epimerase/dehydratase family protein [Bacillota bacterium]
MYCWGTGLLGSEASRELIKRGHQVFSLALPLVPEGELLPKEMKLSFGNYLEMSDIEIEQLMNDCEGFVFAAGVDERIEGTSPIYQFYAKYNIKPLERILKVAKKVGIRHVVVLGSYFSYFARKWEDLKLYDNHPYIRSRIDQANLALSFSDETMDVSVLELPYIFGAQPGRKPVWTFLVEQIKSMKHFTMYPKGGTTMITVKQAAQCIAGALEKGVGKKNYPVGYYNLSWKQMLTIFHRYMGKPHKKIVTIPTFLYRYVIKLKVKEYQSKGIESGLDLLGLVQIMTRYAYIDKKLIEDAFDVQEDDIEEAIGQSVTLSMEVLKGKTKTIDMKGG